MQTEKLVRRSTIASEKIYKNEKYSSTIDFSDAANREADISIVKAEKSGPEIHDLPLCITLVK